MLNINEQGVLKDLKTIKSNLNSVSIIYNLINFN